MGKKKATVITPPVTDLAPPNRAQLPVAAAVEPAAAIPPTLQDASAFLENLPADVLIAMARAKNASAGEDEDDADVWEVKPNSRERISTVRNDIQSRDSHYMQTVAEQTEQLLEGSVMIVESILRAIKPVKPVEMFTVEALSILRRRTKYFSTALQRAGPVAGGSFAAAYDIWHAKRHHFVLSDFKPEELDKAVVDAAIVRNRGQNPRGAHRTEPHHGQERGRGRSRGAFRSFNNTRSRQSPKPYQRDRSRSRSPVKRSN